MPEIIFIVDLDEQALAVRGARGEGERLFVLLFSLDRRVYEVAEISFPRAAWAMAKSGAVWTAARINVTASRNLP